MSKTNEQIAMRVSWNTVLVNVVLSAFKLFAGFYAGSSAMISDAVHSLSDVLSTFVVMVGVKLANQKSDTEHPYGHERLECVAAIVLAVMLFGVGLLIGWDGIQKIMAGIGASDVALAAPGGLALVAAVVSIVVKEIMYWYTRAAAKKVNSGALMADAWHHRSDAMSSVGSFAGILGARLGFPILDPVASVVICLFILKVSLDIFRDATGKMVDKAGGPEIENAISTVILAQTGVVRIDHLQTRLFGDKIYVDVEISVANDATLQEGHEVAHRVHDAIEAGFDNIKHCMVHVNPVADPQSDWPTEPEK